MKRTILSMAYLTAFSIFSNAQVTWDGDAGTNNWGDATNWSGDVLPTATDEVLIDLSGSTINFAGTASVINVEVKNACTLNIASGATLTVSGATTDDGVETSPSGTIVNDGTLNIGTGATNDIDGLYTKGSFTNNGTISIDGVGEHGIRMAGGTFTNNSGGTITVTNVGTGDSNGDGIYLDDDGGTACLVTNNGTMTVTMTSSGDDGVYLKDASQFNNTGTLTIDCNAGNDMGLHLVGMSTKFTNTGTATVINAKDYGIQVDGANAVGTACTLDNSGTFTVQGGSNAGSSNDGLRLRRGGYVTNSGTFNLDATGDDSIQINDTNVGGASYKLSTFDNSGLVNIENSTDHGMELFGNFNNLTGGIFQADGCTDDGIRLQTSSGHTGVFANSGHINVDNSGSDDIEVDESDNFTNSATATFAPGSSPGDLKIRGDFDLGSATVSYEIDGTSSFDQILNKNITGSTNTLTISGATAALVWGYTPTVGDCFKIVDESGGVSGPWASITSDDASIIYSVDYFSNAAEVKICVDAITAPNNNCTNAMELATNAPGTISGQSFANATASGSGAESCDGNTSPASSDQKDLWYKVNTDDDGGDLTINATGGASSDLVLALYDGCGGTPLACSDGSGDAGTEMITYADPAFTGKGDGGSSRSDIDYWVRVYEKSPSGSDFTISALGTALPIEIVSFSGKAEKQGNVLTWETASEINNDYQALQKSSDGKSNWTEVDRVSSIGSGSKGASYEITDTNPYQQTYYRIFSKDYDGQKQLSDVIAVTRRDVERYMEIYPNPVRDVLYINTNHDRDDLSIVLYNSDGKVLWQNTGKEINVPFGDQPTGVYFLTVTNAQEKTVHKIVK